MNQKHFLCVRREFDYKKNDTRVYTQTHDMRQQQQTFNQKNIFFCTRHETQEN